MNRKDLRAEYWLKCYVDSLVSTGIHPAVIADEMLENFDKRFPPQEPKGSSLARAMHLLDRAIPILHQTGPDAARAVEVIESEYQRLTFSLPEDLL